MTRTMSASLCLAIAVGCGEAAVTNPNVNAPADDRTNADAAAATTSPVATTDAATPAPVQEARPADAGSLARADAGASPATANAVVITEADNGKTVTAKKGQDVVLSLAGNPSTGYDWAVSRVDKTLGQPKSEFVSGAASPDAVGAGGKRTFTWSTKSPLELKGDHVVELEYKRSWEPGKATKTFKVTIKIVD